MTNIDIAAIRARVEAASEGPWATGADEAWADALAPWALIIDANYPLIELQDGPQGIADAQFIAGARTDVEDLLALIADQAAVIEAAKRATATWRFHAYIPTADLARTIDEAERKLDEAVERLPAESAENGCDDCSVEPGERHRYFGCLGNGRALLRVTSTPQAEAATR